MPQDEVERTQGNGASDKSDRAVAVPAEPEVSALRASIPSAIADVLDAAADLLEKEGRWTQGSLSRPMPGGGTCYCALGAIFWVAKSHEGASAADFFEAALPPSVGPGELRPIAKWNDDPKRTQAEVVAMLRAQAIEARRAATGTGAVHESAVAESDAPQGGQP